MFFISKTDQEKEELIRNTERFDDSFSNNYFNPGKGYMEAFKGGGPFMNNVEDKLTKTELYFDTMLPHVKRLVSLIEEKNHEEIMLCLADLGCLHKDCAESIGLILHDTILEEADKITEGHRKNMYGSPENCFGLISEFWNSYIGGDSISPKDVAIMMILLKIAREKNAHKRDNLVDIVGYAKMVAKLEGDE